MQFRIHTLLIVSITVALAFAVSGGLHVALRVALAVGVLGFWLGAGCLRAGTVTTARTWRGWMLVALGVAVTTVAFSAVVVLLGHSLRAQVQLLRGAD